MVRATTWMSRSAEKKPSASLLRVVADAERLGLRIAPVRLDDGTNTATAAAAACNCTVGQIVKSIIFRVSGSDRHVLFLTAGNNRVDIGKASAVAGASLEKADAAGVRAHTGFAIGGVSPLGQLTPIETFLDPDILQYRTVWAAAGTPHHVFEIDPKSLAEALKPTRADFTVA
jgi:prolyl-tRNA editing enzyme YbaK/EbsC (Cys-tRNA(Pro) deacylase)